MHDLHLRLSAISLRQPTGSSVGRESATIPDPRAYLTPSNKLSCSLDCACRCHSPLLEPIVPRSLVPYLGQVTVSKRILHAIGASPWECNVQTCRRDRKTSHRLAWVARWWFVTISISSSSFTMSLHPPRYIPDHAPVWGMLNRGDVDALQALFAAGKASVYDVGEDGQTLFYVSPFLVEAALLLMSLPVYMRSMGSETVRACAEGHPIPERRRGGSILRGEPAVRHNAFCTHKCLTKRIIQVVGCRTCIRRIPGNSHRAPDLELPSCGSNQYGCHRHLPIHPRRGRCGCPWRVFVRSGSS